MARIGERKEESIEPQPDPLCPVCGRRRDMLVDKGEGGAPARCVAYHPGYDKPGIRRFTPSGICWLVDERGIRRRDPANDVLNRHPQHEPR